MSKCEKIGIFIYLLEVVFVFDTNDEQGVPALATVRVVE